MSDASQRGDAPGSEIEAAFDDGSALVPYVTAGDPSPEATKEYVRALARGGADLIELGLPFSEPIAEGPTIQTATFRALDAGMTPDRFFDLVAGLDVGVPLLTMTYYNLIYQYGDEEGPKPFVAAAAEAGLSGIIVPDLPVEESQSLKEACDAHGLDLVLIVAPTTRGERLDRIMEQVSGFAYVQARLGTTGARTNVSEQTYESLGKLAGYDVPKAVGFGVSEREHAAAIIESGADGVIVGSALVDIIAEGGENGDPVEEVAARLEAKAEELKAGAEEGFEQRVPEPEGR